MHIIQLLKICIAAAFVGTLLTGAIFIIRSSDEEDAREHVKGAVFRLNKAQKADAEADVVPKSNVVLKSARPAVHQPDSTPTTTTTTTSSTTVKATTASLPMTVKPEVLKELQEVESSRPTSIHTFYYPWYGSPAFDERWYHWNHPRLAPWDPSQAGKYPKGNHTPPNDIASSYYPSLGPYSSRDPAVIDRHLKWIASAGIDCIVVSWYPKGMADEQGYPWDSLMPELLNATAKNRLKLTFHLEPYKTRTAQSVRDDIEYILKNYGSHPAFYRTAPKVTESNRTEELPLLYVYDSYRITADEWESLTKSIRNTPLDALLIGLYLQKDDGDKLKRGGFDGVYTYFAAEGFSYGSTMANWPSISTFCAKNGLLFIPSVGPGYDDTKVRPWNAKNSHDRNNGEYYKEHLKMAHTAKADIVSITSFNEWHEGTQIEPAMPFKDENDTDITYAQYDKGPEQYLEITLEMVKTYFTPHHENIAMRVERIV